MRRWRRLGNRTTRGALPAVLVVLALVSTIPAGGETPEGTQAGTGTGTPPPDHPILVGDPSGHFTENLGQWGQDVAFVARCGFGHAVFEGDGVVYDVAMPEGGNRVRFSFVDGSPAAVVGEGDAGFPTNYLLGNDSAQWVTGARSYRELVYEDVWPGVDVRYRFSEGRLKYDLILDGDADPWLVRFRVEGCEGLRASGDRLDIGLPGGGWMADADLVAWCGDGTPVAASYRVEGNTFGFSVDREEGRSLVIDPVVMHSSTFLGGTYGEKPIDVVIDGNDDIIIVGWTDSTDFPVTAGAYDRVMNNTDVVVTKMNHNASRVIWATYLGGTRTDWVNAVTVDEQDHLYIAGNTWSGDFPMTSGTYSTGINLDTGPYNIDMYVTKMTPDGDEVEASTFIGGTTAEEPYDIKVRDGVVAVGGMTISADFPTTWGPHNSNFGAAVIMTFDDELRTMESSWVWDGIGSESVRSLVIEEDGNIVLGGWTSSPGFPTTPGALLSYKPGGAASFVARFSPEDQLPLFCTYLGGGDTSHIMSLLEDGDGNIYVAGYTRPGGVGFPTTEGAFDRQYDNNYSAYMEGFVARLDTNGTRLIASTLMGGEGKDSIADIALGPDGTVCGVGTVTSPEGLTVTDGCHDGSYGGDSEGYVFQLDADLSDLVYASFHGGSYDEELTAVQVDAVDNLVVVGYTGSADMPVTEDGFQTRFGSYGDMVVSVIGEYLPTSAPLSLVAQGNEGWIDLSWMPPDEDGGYPVREYHVLRGDTTEDLQLHSIQDGACTFRDEDVEWGRVYHYAIIASNWKGKSPMSNVASARSVTVPGRPLNLTAEAGLGVVTMSWRAPSFTGGLPLTGFNVYRTGEDGVRQLVEGVGPYAISYEDTTSEDGTNYTYSITAVNEYGESRRAANATVMTTAVPSPPRELEHVYGSMYIRLGWLRPLRTFGLPLTGYRIYKVGTDGESELVAILEASERAYNDTQVMLGQPVQYYVTATNARGESQPSRVIDAMVKVPPGAPTDVSAVAGEEFVRVTWVPPEFDGASTLTGYRVYLVDDDGAAQCVGGQNVGGLEDVQFAFLHDVPYDGVVRRYFVTALNSEGEGPPSEVAETQVYDLPSAPEGLTVEWGDGWLGLHWQAPVSDGGTAVRSYRVYRRLADEDSMVLLLSLPVGTLTFEDGDMANGVEASYQVTCTNMIGEGPPCTPVSAVPAGLPDAPLGVSAEGLNATVRLSWSPPGWDGGRTVTGYRVYLVANGSTPSLLAQLQADETEFLHEGLLNGRVYLYTVRAMNVVGASEPSGMVDARPVGPPSAPVDISAFWTGDHVLLTWDRPADGGGSPLLGYVLRREGTGGGAPIELVDPTFSDYEVEAGTSYNYTIHAYSAAGEGPTARVTVTVPQAEPEPVEPEAMPWSYLVLLVVLVVLTVALLYTGLRRRSEGPKGEGSP